MWSRQDLLRRIIVNQKIIDKTKFNNPRISPMDEFKEIRGSPRRLKIEVTIVTSFVNMGACVARMDMGVSYFWAYHKQYLPYW